MLTRQMEQLFCVSHHDDLRWSWWTACCSSSRYDSVLLWFSLTEKELKRTRHEWLSYFTAVNSYMHTCTQKYTHWLTLQTWIYVCTCTYTQPAEGSHRNTSAKANTSSWTSLTSQHFVLTPPAQPSCEPSSLHTHARLNLCKTMYVWVCSRDRADCSHASVQLQLSIRHSFIILCQPIKHHILIIQLQVSALLVQCLNQQQPLKYVIGDTESELLSKNLNK